MHYSPVRHFTQGIATLFSYDLHVLGTPPALILSQDQTLEFKLAPIRPRRSSDGLETCSLQKLVLAFRSCYLFRKYTLGWSHSI